MADILRELVDHYRTAAEQYGGAPNPLVGTVYMQVKALLKTEEPRDIKAALDCLALHATHPMGLPTLVYRVKQRRVTFRETDGRKITGFKFVRGSHSGMYVRDPLGTDVPTYAVP